MHAVARLLSLVALGLLAACGPAPVPRSPPEPGMTHVHALAVDPKDPSALYAATHTGLFHVNGENKAQRVGGHYHDLMGFTVAGPDDFIASGHPDLRTPDLRAPGKPPLLGLVQSTDGGADWRPLSLLGEVDFHSIESVHGLVYGYDSTSGRFMVSSDRTTWDTRSTLALADFAVSPSDPELVVASTEEGLIASTDGGCSWRPAADALYVVLDWTDTGLYGITPDGTVAVSPDAGRTWQPRGAIGGPPEALLARGGLLVAVAADRGIVQSHDGGRTWAVRLATDE